MSLSKATEITKRPVGNPGNLCWILGKSCLFLVSWNLKSYMNWRMENIVCQVTKDNPTFRSMRLGSSKCMQVARSRRLDHSGFEVVFYLISQSDMNWKKNQKNLGKPLGPLLKVELSSFFVGHTISSLNFAKKAFFWTLRFSTNYPIGTLHLPRIGNRPLSDHLGSLSVKGKHWSVTC